MINRFPFAVLFILSVWVGPTSYAQVNSKKFYCLNSNNGLSQNHVNAIIKDSRGFMWFATDDGLNRFDGYQFTVYKNIPSQKGSLSNNIVYDVLEDKSGKLWVATQNGLNLLDREKTRLPIFLKTAERFSSNVYWRTQRRDYGWAPPRDLLWFYLVDRPNGSRTRTEATACQQITFTGLRRTRTGRLWIATAKGLNCLDPEKNTFSVFYASLLGNTVAGNQIKSVFCDSRGNIWVGTQGNGVSHYNPEPTALPIISGHLPKLPDLATTIFCPLRKTVGDISGLVPKTVASAYLIILIVSLVPLKTKSAIPLA
jgi:ligand-binding sensor domain-containing protein